MNEGKISQGSLYGLFILAPVIGLLMFGLGAACGILIMRVGHADTARVDDVVRLVSAVVTDMQDAESGQRGYMITHDKVYLTTYFMGTSRIKTDMENLHSIIKGDRLQEERFQLLQTNLNKKLSEMANIVHLTDTDPNEAVRIIKTNEGRSLMGQVRSTLNDIQLTELRDVQKREFNFTLRTQE